MHFDPYCCMLYLVGKPIGSKRFLRVLNRFCFGYILSFSLNRSHKSVYKNVENVYLTMFWYGLNSGRSNCGLRHS